MSIGGFLPDERFLLLCQKIPAEFWSIFFERSCCGSFASLLSPSGCGHNKVPSRFEDSINFDKKQAIWESNTLLATKFTRTTNFDLHLSYNMIYIKYDLVVQKGKTQIDHEKMKGKKIIYRKTKLIPNSPRYSLHCKYSGKLLAH